MIIIFLNNFHVSVTFLNMQTYNSTVKNTFTYGAETLAFNKNLESELVSMEIEYLRRYTRSSRMENNINNVRIEKLNIKGSMLHYIRYKQLIWHDHVRTSSVEKLPWNVLKWCPPGRRRKWKILKFTDAGSNNCNERKGISIMEWINIENLRTRVT